MKISTLLLLAILAFIGYEIWQTGNFSPKTESAAVPATAAISATTTVPARPAVAGVAPVAAPAPATPESRPLQWQRGVLEVVHGKVVENRPNDLLVTTIEVEPDMSTARSAFSKEGRRKAEEAAHGEDFSVYGRVMTMENSSTLHPAASIPETKAHGTLVLKDYPNHETMAIGTPVNVVAAPLGNLNYTVRFNVTADQPGSWMWKANGTLKNQ